MFAACPYHSRGGRLTDSEIKALMAGDPPESCWVYSNGMLMELDGRMRDNVILG